MFRTLLFGSLLSLSLIPTSATAGVTCWEEIRFYQNTNGGYTQQTYTVQRCREGGQPQLTREQKDLLQSYDATTGTIGNEHCNETLEWMGMCNR